MRAIRARARERLPSYRETCEPKPACRTSAYVLWSAFVRAPFRLLSTRAPRQAVLRASFRLAPWLATRLGTSRRTRRAMRPTNFCHLYDLRVPVPRSFPARDRGFHRVDVPRSLGSVRHDRGSRCFTTPKIALADRIKTHALSRPAFLATVSVARSASVGVLFPRRPIPSSL